jgi:membrane protease YdiL (CAAX protease family)
MGWLAALLGLVASTGAWELIRRGGRSIWRVMPVTYGVLGVGALVFADPRLADDPRLASTSTMWSLGTQVWLGLVIGVGLFAATRVFVAIVTPRWQGFAADTAAQYAQRLGVSAAVAITLSLVSLAGEELFWRGAVQPALVDGGLDALAAAGVAWGVYVVATLESRSLPVIAGAVVGGAVWAALPLVAGGIAASLCCHAAWTVLMIVLPPRAGRAMMTP